jgi:hypothetical protein
MKLTLRLAVLANKLWLLTDIIALSVSSEFRSISRRRLKIMLTAKLLPLKQIQQD